MITPILGYKTREQTFSGLALFRKKAIKPAIDISYKCIDRDSADYIRYCYNTFKKWCAGQVTEVNVETERLQNIVKSDEPCIFIMNHTSNQRKDIDAAKFFNTLLYREYLYSGKAKDCPRSKVMANSHILRKKPDGGEFYNWLGVIPVYAGLHGYNREKNQKALLNLTHELTNNKINLFIFPEGALAGIRFLPLEYKFQAGISSVIKRVLDAKDSIKVVPLGFAHSKKESCVHIGEPVYFTRDGIKSYASKGNIDSNFFSKRLKELFNGKDKIMLTENGKPVWGKKLIPYISGILVKNLKACKKEAKSDLINAKSKVYEL